MVLTILQKQFISGLQQEDKTIQCYCGKFYKTRHHEKHVLSTRHILANKYSMLRTLIIKNN